LSSILEVLTQQLSGNVLKQLSRELGTEEETASTAMATALPTLLGALAKNASKPQGAQALANALDKDHDGSVLDNPAGLLQSALGGNGDGILRHVLGGRRQRVENAVGQASGLDAGSVGKMMTMLAPIVMGALGKAKRQSNMDSNALAGLLGQQRSELESRAPQQMGLLGNLLDADSDGDVDLSDMAKQGAGLLGKLFGGR
jgi:hypothetical protein